MILTKYLKFVERTEPPINFHRWSFLSSVAACIGRNLYIPFGQGAIYPNMYISLIGTPGTRKSTAINMAKKPLMLCGYNTFSATKTSKQKFMLDWEAGITENAASDFLEEAEAEGFSCNEMFIACDELLDFLGPSNFEFLNLLTTLWDNLPKYEERLKNSKSTCVYNPTINLLGGMTPVGLQLAMPPEIAGTGMLSRMILVFGDRPVSKVAWPRRPHADEFKEFSDFFTKVRTLTGEVQIAPDAYEMLEDIYNQWEALEDGRLQYYCSRRHTHLLKLCIICLALDAGLPDAEPVYMLTTDHVLHANTLLTYTEATMSNALGEFGKSKLSDATQRIVQFMESKGGPCTIEDLFKAASHDVENYQSVVEIVRNLARADRVTHADGKFILKRRKVDASTAFTDFKTYIPENPTNDHSKPADFELPPSAIPVAAPKKEEPPVPTAW